MAAAFTLCGLSLGFAIEDLTSGHRWWALAFAVLAAVQFKLGRALMRDVREWTGARWRL